MKITILPGEQAVTVTHRDLQIGDRVRLSPYGAFNDATVVQVTDDKVTFFRSYVQVSEFITSAGLIPYLGFEKFDVFRDSDKTVLLLYRPTPGSFA